ncbi:hypothetical protein H5410_031020 [Solanum commersonii]|uniref:DUF4283 domain-containing protein n=1 Tax=Solanum commersonii TaxID=4109 RepID=A0A9J5YH75_SOLCO|nr:hypothetical protein H5410_031020 [Solanum commersonii]
MFANEKERDRVLCSGPHCLLRRPIIMKPWDQDFNFKEEILTTIPLWINLGKPLYADECTTQTSRISFARILVEMDITRILPNVIKIQDPKRRVLEQQVRYEWKLIFCQKCLQVGHSCIAKPGAPPPKKGIDRALVNDEWVIRMPLLQVMVMEPLFSDHSPLSIEVESQRDIRKKPFRFYNCLTQHPDFKTIIQSSWQR